MSIKEMKEIEAEIDVQVAAFKEKNIKTLTEQQI